MGELGDPELSETKQSHRHTGAHTQSCMIALTGPLQSSEIHVERKQMAGAVGQGGKENSFSDECREDASWGLCMEDMLSNDSQSSTH